MVDMIGLDGVVFLRFLRTMRWMCTVIAILSCAVLIPINLIYNSKHGGLGRNFFYQISIIYVKGRYVEGTAIRRILRSSCARPAIVSSTRTSHLATSSASSATSSCTSSIAKSSNCDGSGSAFVIPLGIRASI